MASAVVLLSGGQDSTTCLFWAKKKYQDVSAVIVDYGQRHRVELESAKKVAEIAKVPFDVLDLRFFKEIGNSSLFTDNDVNEKHPCDDELPSSFVPGRNLIFITVAAMFAYKSNADAVVTGVCQTDYSGYPDCRNLTMQSLACTIALGMDKNIKIETPLMFLTKAETVQLAIDLPGCMEALEYSHTCYNGEFPPCFQCPSCILRAKGFQEAGVPDPLQVRWNRGCI